MFCTAKPESGGVLFITTGFGVVDGVTDGVAVGTILGLISAEGEADAEEVGGGILMIGDDDETISCCLGFEYRKTAIPRAAIIIMIMSGAIPEFVRNFILALGTQGLTLCAYNSNYFINSWL